MQDVIFRPFRRYMLLCDNPHMTGEREIDTIKRTLQSAMDRRGIKARPLSIAAGMGETGMRDFLSTGKDIKVGTLKKIAEVLDWPLDDFLGLEPVPLLGQVGAGGAIIFEELEVTETVRRPPGAVGKLIALQVVGSSMLPKYDEGDIVYVRRDHDGVLPAYLNRYCAVRTNDGGTWLKILSPGSQPNRYTLRSLNAPDMENMEVEWASPVIFVMPHFAR